MGQLLTRVNERTALPAGRNTTLKLLYSGVPSLLPTEHLDWLIWQLQAPFQRFFASIIADHDHPIHWWLEKFVYETYILWFGKGFLDRIKNCYDENRMSNLKELQRRWVTSFFSCLTMSIHRVSRTSYIQWTILIIFPLSSPGTNPQPTMLLMSLSLFTWDLINEPFSLKQIIDISICTLCHIC